MFISPWMLLSAKLHGVSPYIRPREFLAKLARTLSSSWGGFGKKITTNIKISELIHRDMVGTNFPLKHESTKTTGYP